MVTAPFRGIFSIAYTPFDEQNRLLWDDFQAICDWVARSGAHGLVWPVMASEYTVISTRERLQGMRIAIEAVAGRIPVVMGVHDTTQDGATALAECAATMGADAIVAMPPWATKLGTPEMITQYYTALSLAAQRPVFVQNIGGGLGSSLSAQTVAQLCREIEWVQYVKEEKAPQGHSVAEILALHEPAIKGVFTGSPCYWIFAEHARGVSGCLPGSYIPDVDARIWDLLEAGQMEEARSIHNAKLVLENSMRCLPYPQAAKEILRRRGIISTAVARHQTPITLDAHDEAELEYGLSVVSPFFRS